LELGEVELFTCQTALVTRWTMAGSSPFSQTAEENRISKPQTQKR
jgi:hypothetical protein